MRYRIFERYHTAPPELARLTALQAIAIAEALKSDPDPDDTKARRKRGRN